MSGIAGIYYLDGRPVEESVLRSMTDVVRHRGPDGIGHWVQGPVGLGHLQLCTTPESLREHQPLASADGDYAITCDGRVDNREELLGDLRRVAPVTQESTDVELILQAYIAWGTDCAKHIIGDFAFAIWDGVRQQLFCARDPIGVRVFHYYYDGHRFIFGTEIKQLLQHPNVPRRLNELMLGLYLCGSFGDGEMTFYEGIRRLPGGYSLVVSRDSLTTHPFWDPDPYDVIRLPAEQDYAERFRELLFEAVRCRLRSSTGVEINLSGGLDSGSVASVAGHLHKNGVGGDAPLSALTLVYRDPPLDESPYVQLIAGQYKIPVTWLDVSDTWALKPAASDIQWDEPFMLHFEAMQCAALESVRERGVRVVLTGEGGDETSMYGYVLHLQDWLRHLRWAAVWRDLRNATPGYRRDALEALGRSLIPGWLRRITGRSGVTIPPWVPAEFARHHSLASWLRRLEPRSRRKGAYLQQRGRNPLFLGGDVRTAAYGIEWRHPLYDSRIVEFLVRIPPGIRFRGGRSKVLLREAMAGVLPDEVRRRAPHGAFGGLFERGLREMETTRIEGLLQEPRLAELGALDAEVLRETFNAYLHGDDTKSGRTFWVFFTEEWLRQAWPPLGGDDGVVEAEPVAGKSGVS